MQRPAVAPRLHERMGAVLTAIERCAPAALAGEWASLHAADPEATPFCSEEWARVWWEHRGAGLEPFLVTVREQGSLVGLAPLVIGQRRGLRRAVGLGTGIGNHWDVLSIPELRVPVARAVAQRLVEERGCWDALVLDRMPPAAALRSALASVGLRARERAPMPAPGFALPDTFEHWLAGLGPNLRKRVRQALRRLDEGELTLHPATTEEGVRRVVREWHALRVRWWRERGRSINAEHADTPFLRFVSDVAAALLPAGLCEVLELRRADEVVGAAVNLVDDHAFYAWMDGFHPDLAKLSPGHLVVAATVRSSIAAGREYYDLMIGDEEYKYRYGATDVELPNLLVTSNRTRSRLTGIATAVLDARSAATATV